MKMKKDPTNLTPDIKASLIMQNFGHLPIFVETPQILFKFLVASSSLPPSAW